MPKIVIHGAVLKGRHVYDTEAVIVTEPERDNPKDQSAVSILDAKGETIGHAPSGFADNLGFLFDNIQQDIRQYFLVA